MLRNSLPGRAALAGIFLMICLSGPLLAQQDLYEEETGVSGKAQELFTKAQRLEQAGQPEEAIKTYQKAIKLEPTYSEAYQQMALAYANLGQFPEAVTAFKEVIRLQPQSGLAHSNLGAAYMKMGRFQEARSSFQEAVRLHPEDAEAHLNLGLALGKLKRDEEAQAEFAQAVKLEPDKKNQARALKNLGLANLNLNRLEEAGKALQEAVNLDPADAQTHYALCVFYARKGDAAAANQEFKALQNLDKDLAQKLKDQIRK
jgi:Flp pilus assembly protein TadD